VVEGIWGVEGMVAGVGVAGYARTVDRLVAVAAVVCVIVVGSLAAGVVEAGRLVVVVAESLGVEGRFVVAALEKGHLLGDAGIVEVVAGRIEDLGLVELGIAAMASWEKLLKVRVKLGEEHGIAERVVSRAQW
jgi:hypothetical protein